MKTNVLDSIAHRSWQNDYQVGAGLLEHNPSAKLLDVGCSDGERTQIWAGSTGTSDIVGLDIQDRGFPFSFVKSNLDRGLPFRDSTFDVVTAQGVIEHVADTDLFVSEIHRVLKPGGYVMVGTPNLASGMVILELLSNKQPHMCHVSDCFIPSHSRDKEWLKSRGWLHRRTFTAEGLRTLLEWHGFKVEDLKMVGYGRFFFMKFLGGLYAGSLRCKARR